MCIRDRAYAVSSLTGKLVTDKKSSTDANERLVTTKQNRALDSFEAFTRRVISVSYTHLDVYKRQS